MALTATEQNKVVQLLGYGGKILQSGSVIYNKILNDRLTSLPSDTETVVRAYLTQVATIETQMNAAPCRLVASAIGDIKVNNMELQNLRSERKRIAREIAVHLDIPYQGTGPCSSVIS